jgi:hypothetical protein
MPLSKQSSNQLDTIFGAGYVSEEHGDETRRYLPPLHDGELLLDFSRILDSLRAALSLR